MTTIELTFPAGRFHATPWGRHVNEGAVEWPPSPWRLLRALVATWKRKSPEISEDLMREMLAALSSPPEFALPPATFSHTRHYMPWFKKGPGDKTLVFDSFVAVAKDSPVIVSWPDLDLPSDQRSVLHCLLPLLGTFGRAESWCSGRLLDFGQEATILANINTRPLNGSPPGGEVIRVLGVDPLKAFGNEHNPRHEISSGRGKNKIKTTTPLYEPDWHLCMETLWLHDQRWSMPPGAVWIDYDRPWDALAQPKPRTVRPQRRPAMQVARFSLDSPVLPLVTETLSVAEAVRINLMGIHGRQTECNSGQREPSPIFSGKNADSSPLSGHRHCYFLPTDENGDGRLDHLTLFTTEGFSHKDLRAIDGIREIKSRAREESGHPLGVVLLGTGVASEFFPGPLKPSRCWVSATPFLAPRHPKTRGKSKHSEAGDADPHRFLIAQLREELARWIERSIATLTTDEIGVELFTDESGNTRRWCPHRQQFAERSIEFKRFRRKRSDDGGRRPAAFFHLTFPNPVPGPIALGHSCHFGLGLFVPAD